jgi:hypothetical protein
VVRLFLLLIVRPTNEKYFNEALLLKAQILAEGFGDIQGAKKCLTKALQSEPKYTQLFQWCETLYRELTTQTD